MYDQRIVISEFLPDIVNNVFDRQINVKGIESQTELVLKTRR